MNLDAKSRFSMIHISWAERNRRFLATLQIFLQIIFVMQHSHLATRYADTSKFRLILQGLSMFQFITFDQFFFVRKEPLNRAFSFQNIIEFKMQWIHQKARK